jgi:hypothetical protein
MDVAFEMFSKKLVALLARKFVPQVAPRRS